MFSKTVFAFIALLPFCLAQINETEVNETASNATEPGSSASTILSSIPFKDYEAVCPYDGPVRIFQFKRVEVKNERDALLFNASSWPAEDMLLKAQCFDLKDFFGEEWVSWFRLRSLDNFEPNTGFYRSMYQRPSVDWAKLL